MDTRTVEGWNELDYVQMTGAMTPIEEPVRNMEIAKGRTRGVSTACAF